MMVCLRCSRGLENDVCKCIIVEFLLFFSTEDGALYKWTAESKTSKRVKQSAVNSLNAQDGYKRTFIKRWTLGSSD